MFNRNNYVSLKDLPMFVESYEPSRFSVNGQNMTLYSIIQDLDDKQQSYTLLDNQIATFNSMNADPIVIQGLQSAKMGIQQIIGNYQNVLSTDVSLNDFTELLSSLSQQPEPSIPVQRQINFLKSVVESKSS